MILMVSRHKLRSVLRLEPKCAIKRLEIYVNREAIRLEIEEKRHSRIHTNYIFNVINSKKTSVLQSIERIN